MDYLCPFVKEQSSGGGSGRGAITSRKENARARIGEKERGSATPLPRRFR
jgi:hypothetical protein